MLPSALTSPYQIAAPLSIACRIQSGILKLLGKPIQTENVGVPGFIQAIAKKWCLLSKFKKISNLPTISDVADLIANIEEKLPPRPEFPSLFDYAYNFIYNAIHSLLEDGYVPELAELLAMHPLPLPGSVKQAMLMGQEYNRLGMFHQALDLLNRTEQEWPVEQNLCLYRAVAYFCLKEYDVCHKELTREIKIAGKTPGALYWLAQLNAAIQQYEPALALLDELLSNHPPPVFTCLALAKKAQIMCATTNYAEKTFKCYQQACAVYGAPAIWRIFVHDEYAIALIQNGQQAHANKIIEAGCAIGKPTKFNYNPCQTLKLILSKSDTPTEGEKPQKTLARWPQQFLLPSMLVVT